MSQEKTEPANARLERGVGNIYDRLEDARRKRDRLLETPQPANDDWQAAGKRPPLSRPFPKLKPPRPDSYIAPEADVPKPFGWQVPAALAVLIGAVIFVFAVA